MPTRRGSRRPVGRERSLRRRRDEPREELSERRDVGASLSADHVGDDPCPARLVTRSQPGAVVAVEVLVEEDVVLPGRIALELVDPAVTGPASVLADEEERDEPPAEVLADLRERSTLAGACRVLELEVVTEVPGVAEHGVDDEVVDREPDRPAPVG